jgi:hypothetical protein
MVELEFGSRASCEFISGHNGWPLTTSLYEGATGGRGGGTRNNNNKQLQSHLHSLEEGVRLLDESVSLYMEANVVLRYKEVLGWGNLLLIEWLPVYSK